MKLQIHRPCADERFVDLVDCIANERNELDKIAGSEKKLALRTINDLPAFCSAAVSPSRRVTNLWDAEGRLYLTRDASKHFMRSFVMDSEVGAYIEKRSSKALADLTNVLPSRLSELMIGQAIPSTSWGANLHNLLSDTDWNKLRASTFAASCYRCEICGTSNGLECHELWRYDEPFSRTPRPSGTDFGIQTLAKLISLCGQCHEAHHLGNAKLRGRLEQAFTHIGEINEWSTEEVGDYYRYMAATWRRRSQFLWMLDLSILELTRISLLPKWKVLDDLFLCAETRTGATVTKILAKDWMAACSDVAYCTTISTNIFKNSTYP